MRKLVIALMIAAAASIPLRATAQEGGGGTRSIFTLGAGSRAIAMGGAFSAAGDDASALYYNPAALKLNQAPTLMASHIQLFSGFSDATYDFLGLVYPTLGAGAFGVGILTAGTGAIRGFDEFSVETGEFSYRESQGILSYAFDVPWRFAGLFSVGTSVKILSQRVGEFADTGTGVDLGLLYRQNWIEGLILGVNLQDIAGASTKLVSESDKVYRTLMLGLGYRRAFSAGSALTLAVQMDMPEKADRAFRAGAEYSHKRMLSIRLGYDSDQITAGVGFGWRGYTVDYGYFSRQEAGSSHPMTVTAVIGAPLAEKISRREEQRRADEQRRLAEIFARRVAEHIDAAQRYRAEGRLENALDEAKVALEFEPGNEQAAALLEQIGGEILAEQEERARAAGTELLVNQHFGLGLKYYSSNEYILARAEWRNVLELDPGNARALDYLERTEARLAEEVEQHVQAALDNEGRGRLSAALSEWNIVRMIDPGNEQAAAAIERISRSMEALDRDLRDASHRLQVIELFEQAAAAFGAGRYEESAVLLRRVLERQPDHEEAMDLLRRAQRRMTPLTDEEKEQVRRLYIEGMTHFAKKDYLSAIAAWNSILEIDPENGSVIRNIEEARQRLRKLGPAEDE